MRTNKKIKKADMILTKDIARIGRDFIKTEKFIDDIKKHIEFKTYYNFDSENSSYNSILKSMQESHSEYLSKQIKARKDRKRQLALEQKIESKPCNDVAIYKFMGG